VNSLVAEILSEAELKTSLYIDINLFLQFITKRIQCSIDLKHTSTNLPALQLAHILSAYIQGLFRVSSIVEIKKPQNQTKDFFPHIKFIII